MGTTQSAIARLERGATVPTVETLCRLGELLGLRFEIDAEEGLRCHPLGREQPETGRIEKGQPILDELRARRQEIIQVVANHGGRNVRVFGSVARGDAHIDSDVDILVDLDIEAQGLAYFGQLEDLRRALANLLGRAVDVVDAAGLRDMRATVFRDAIPI